MSDSPRTLPERSTTFDAADHTDQPTVDQATADQATADEHSDHQPPPTSDSSDSISWARSIKFMSNSTFGATVLLIAVLLVIQLNQVDNVLNTSDAVSKQSVPAADAAQQMIQILNEMPMTAVRYSASSESAAVDYFILYERFLEQREALAAAGTVSEATLAAIDRNFQEFNDFNERLVFNRYDPYDEGHGITQYERFWQNESAPFHEMIARYLAETREGEQLAGNPSDARNLGAEHVALEELSSAARNMDLALAGVASGSAEADFIRARSEATTALALLNADPPPPYLTTLQRLFTRYERSADLILESYDPQAREDALAAAIESNGLRRLSLVAKLNKIAAREVEAVKDGNTHLANLVSGIRSGLFLTFILVTAVLGATLFLIHRHVIAPILRIAGHLAELRHDPRTVEIPNADQRNELGLAQGNLRALRNTLIVNAEDRELKLKLLESEHLADLTKVNENLELKQRELEVRAERAQAMNAELEQFVHIASHDLREPLKMIHGYCELLEDNLGTGLNPEAQIYLDNTMRGARRAVGLLDDLRDLARLDTGGLELVECDLDAMFYQVLAERSEKMEDSGLSIEIGALGYVHAYELLIRQVFVNLLENAINYSGRNQTLQVSVPEEDEEFRTIRFVNQLPPQQLRAALDKRIPNMSRDRLFLPFVRGRSDKEGTGMGLTICRKIVELHQGTIWISNDRPHEFVISFTLSKRLNDDSRLLNDPSHTGVDSPADNDRELAIVQP